MKTAKTRSKPKCNSTPCGYTCISKKYTCSDKIHKRDADALIKAVAKSSPIDSQKPPTDLSTPAAVEAYVRAWQTDRGYGNTSNSIIEVHDIDHALTYKSSGLSPEEINAKYGYPDRPYDGKPTFAEEAFVMLHYVSSVPGVTKQLAIDTVMYTFSITANGGNYMNDAFPDGKPERLYYANSNESLKRVNDMYSYIDKASAEDRDLSRRNAVRYVSTKINDTTGNTELVFGSSTTEVKGNVFEFSEGSGFGLPLGMTVGNLTMLLVSIANCSGKPRASFETYVEQAKTLLSVN